MTKTETFYIQWDNECRRLWLSGSRGNEYRAARAMAEDAAMRLREEREDALRFAVHPEDRAGFKFEFLHPAH